MSGPLRSAHHYLPVSDPLGRARTVMRRARSLSEMLPAVSPVLHARLGTLDATAGLGGPILRDESSTAPAASRGSSSWPSSRGSPSRVDRTESCCSSSPPPCSHSMSATTRTAARAPPTLERELLHIRAGLQVWASRAGDLNPPCWPRVHQNPSYAHWGIVSSHTLPNAVGHWAGVRSSSQVPGKSMSS